MSTKSNKQVHVVPSDGGWKVVRPNAERASAVYNNKSDALKRGKGLAKKDGSSFIEHRKDGRITNVTSYGKKKK